MDLRGEDRAAQLAAHDGPRDAPGQVKRKWTTRSPHPTSLAGESARHPTEPVPNAQSS